MLVNPDLPQIVNLLGLAEESNCWSAICHVPTEALGPQRGGNARHGQPDSQAR